MSNVSNLIATLTKIQRYDAALARVSADVKKKEVARDAIKKRLAEAELTLAALTKNFNERKRQLSSEELAIRDEQDKLVNRRKSLQSLNNYKVQQAAEREIDHTSRTLSQREEGLIGALDQANKAEEDLKVRQRAVEAIRAELLEAEGAIKEAEADRAAKVAAGGAERDALFATLKPNDQTLYSRTKDRYPTDALAIASKSSCSGCFMGLSPQIMVQASRGDAIVRCTGCGRIVILAEGEGQVPSAHS
jgi:predicted  nucleic acid-binding Zn-ribbon protein